MKKKACIYPYIKDSEILIENNQLLKDYSIIAISSFKGWLLGCDNINSEINVLLDFNDDNLQKFDIIIIPNIKINTYDKEIIETIKLLECKGKEIISFCPRIYQNVKLYGPLLDINCIYEIKKINSFIIMINGLGENTQKSDLCIKLYNKLTNLGLSINVIGSSEYSELFGFIDFPSFMYSSNIDENKKVFLFNDFISNIQTKNNSDIIILSIPSGIISLSDRSFNNWGLTHFIVSQALEIDYNILTTYAQNYLNNSLNLILDLCNKRLNSDINKVVMSNNAIDWIGYSNSNEITYMSINDKLIDKYIDLTKSENNIDIISMRDIDLISKDIIKNIKSRNKKYKIILGA